MVRPAGFEPATSWFVAVNTIVDPAQLTGWKGLCSATTWTQSWTQRIYLACPVPGASVGLAGRRGRQGRSSISAKSLFVRAHACRPRGRRANTDTHASSRSMSTARGTEPLPSIADDTLPFDQAYRATAGPTRACHAPCAGRSGSTTYSVDLCGPNAAYRLNRCSSIVYGPLAR